MSYLVFHLLGKKQPEAHWAWTNISAFSPATFNADQMTAVTQEWHRDLTVQPSVSDLMAPVILNGTTEKSTSRQVKVALEKAAQKCF